jgi:hypothetical protein
MPAGHVVADPDGVIVRYMENGSVLDIGSLAYADFINICANHCMEPNTGLLVGVDGSDNGGVASEESRVASHLTQEGIQALLDNLEWLTRDPQLAHSLSKSTVATPAQREMLDEMQKGAMSAKELEEVAEGAEPDPVKRKTLMQKLAFMTVVQRLTLALKGAREERMLLIRDPNKLVQKCVLQSPRLTETEVENFAAMANLSAEILRTISLKRLFMKNYTIVKNLVSNPKTPLDVSLHLFPRLNATDLVKLMTNKNVPDTLRSMAQKLHRKRKQGVSS